MQTDYLITRIIIHTLFFSGGLKPVHVVNFLKTLEQNHITYQELASYVMRYPRILLLLSTDRP